MPPSSFRNARNEEASTKPIRIDGFRSGRPFFGRAEFDFELHVFRRSTSQISPILEVPLKNC